MCYHFGCTFYINLKTQNKKKLKLEKSMIFLIAIEKRKYVKIINY